MLVKVFTSKLKQKPAMQKKHLPWSDWGLGHTPVRIQIRIERYMNGRKLNYPLKSMKFDCESLKY